MEKLNDINISVFGYMKQNSPFQFTYQTKKFTNVMNLLLMTEDENKHYVLIKDFNRFMYKLTKYEHKKYFGMYFLH